MRSDDSILLERIDQLQQEPNPRRAEGMLHDILQPLLEAEEYHLQHTGGPEDGGLDFLATREDRFASSRLGIQHKHSRRPVAQATVHEVIGTAITNNLDRMMLVSTSGFAPAARSALNRDLPTVVELVDPEFLRAWATRPERRDDPDRSAALEAITQLSSQLARVVARDPRELDNIEWRDLERLVHAIFSGLGFTATLTPPAKDGGRDVILHFTAQRAQRTFFVEVKHWRSRQKVGGSWLTDFLKVMASEKADGGLFLSTSGYAANAIETITEVERRGLYAGEGAKIVGLCRTFVRAEAGLFAAPEDLTEIITCDTVRADTAELSAQVGSHRRGHSNLA